MWFSLRPAVRRRGLGTAGPAPAGGPPLLAVAVSVWCTWPGRSAAALRLRVSVRGSVLPVAPILVVVRLVIGWLIVRLDRQQGTQRRLRVKGVSRAVEVGHGGWGSRR